MYVHIAQFTLTLKVDRCLQFYLVLYKTNCFNFVKLQLKMVTQVDTSQPQLVTINPFSGGPLIQLISGVGGGILP